LFASQDVEGFWKQGLLLGGGADQLIAQLIGVGAIILWTSVTAFVLFFTIKKTIGLRVSEEEELMGLDILEHGSPGYGEGFGAYVVPSDPSIMVSPVHEPVAPVEEPAP
jgi:Amt family ammonium transporter